jgi:GT2 family glycosyltransferase
MTGEYRIIVVDNNSPNKSGEKLQKVFENNCRIDVILESENLGFAKGNNIGYKKAKEYNPRFIVVLNNDTELTQKSFCELVEKAYAESRFDILGPDIVTARELRHQNPQREMNYSLAELKKAYIKLWVKNHFKIYLWIKCCLNIKNRKERSVDQSCQHDDKRIVLNGAAYVFSEDYIAAHDNCFYANTFMYYESYILRHLGDREGLTFRYYPQIVVRHYCDVSTDSVYKTRYKKTEFVNMCLMASCKEFIRIYNKKGIRIG